MTRVRQSHLPVVGVIRKEAWRMMNRGNNAAWILVVILAVCFQVVFVFADSKQTATGTAIDFSKAYFMMDADMEAYLCSELIGDDEASATEAYLQAKTDEANARGFGTGMVRQMIYHVKTDTLAQDAESATIHIKGLRRTCIHPVFAYVAKLFQLGRVHEFEETLKLMKEDGKWKVCGAPYGLALDV
jgi:hypothetical protein